MAASFLNSLVRGFYVINFKMLEHIYHNIKFFVFDNLCADVIIWHDVL